MNHTHNITIKEIEDYLNKIFDIQSQKEENEQKVSMLDYEVELEGQLLYISKLNFLTAVN